MQRRKVVFPDPDGPISTTTSPRVTPSETPFSTSWEPNDFLISVTCTINAVPSPSDLVSCGSDKVIMPSCQAQGSASPESALEPRPALNDWLERCPNFD